MPVAALKYPYWKLQYAPNPPNSTVIEVEAAKLLKDFSAVPYYYQKDGALHFQARVDAATTSGTKYPRSELREMNVDGTKAAWNASKGVHWMRVVGWVSAVPEGKPEVVVAQIHNADDDVTEVLTKATNKGLMLTARIRGKSDGVPPLIPDYKLGRTYDVVVWVENGKCSLWESGNKIVEFPCTDTRCYFKAGAYVQANETNASRTTEVGSAELVLVDAWHTGQAPKPDPRKAVSAPPVKPVEPPAPVPPTPSAPAQQFILLNPDGTWKFVRAGGIVQ